MKLLRQLGIIAGICLAGEFIHRLLHIPIPGSVIGMIVLFICLCTGIVKLEMIDEISKFLLDHLAFFFIPAGVGLLASMNILNGKWPAFLGVCLVTTVIIMVITGQTIQLLKRRQNK